MTTEKLSKLFYSKGWEKAMKVLFAEFERNEIGDELFVNLSVLLSHLISNGEANMVCHIDKR